MALCVFVFHGCGSSDRYDQTLKEARESANQTKGKTDTGAILSRDCLAALEEFGRTNRTTVTGIISRSSRGWLITTQWFDVQPNADKVAVSLDGIKWHDFLVSQEEQKMNLQVAKKYIQYASQATIDGLFSAELTTLMKDNLVAADVEWQLRLYSGTTMVAESKRRGLYSEPSISRKE